MTDKSDESDEGDGSDEGEIISNASYEIHCLYNSWLKY